MDACRWMDGWMDTHSLSHTHPRIIRHAMQALVEELKLDAGRKKKLLAYENVGDPKVCRTVGGGGWVG